MQHKDPDEALIRRCQSANGPIAEAAFDELFARYRDRVFSLAFRLLGNRSDAEDAAQEAFVTVYQKINDFRFSARFYTWLYRIIYNLCVDLRRRVVSERSSGGEQSLETLERLEDRSDGPLEVLEKGEARTRDVERALQRLSEPLRAVVILRYLEDLPYYEIAEVLECSLGTVKSRLSRAHHFLQSTLRPLE